MAYSITKDDYFDREQPAKSEELFNSVSIATQPLVAGDVGSEVYRSDAAVTVPAGGSVTVECTYNALPVMDATADIEDEGAAGLADQFPISSLTRHNGEIGHSVESVTNGGLILCVLHWN